MNNEPIDVLAVVDATIKLAQEAYIPEHHEVVALEQARAAIAELIEASRWADEIIARYAVNEDGQSVDTWPLRAALARVGGAK